MSSLIENPSPSHLEVVTSLGSRTSLKALNALYTLVSSCAGPAGKIHMVTNNCGGHVTMTSSSQRLLSAIAFSRPELKLIVSAVQTHLKRYHDCGLFMMSSCLNLVQLSLQSGYKPHLFQRLNETFLNIILDTLNSSGCAVVLKADFSDLRTLLAYVRSIFNAKPLLNTKKEYNATLAELVVRCFVHSIPSDMPPSFIRRSDGVFILGREREDALNSRMVEGLLIECPELSAIDGPMPLNVLTVPAVETSSVRVALVTCSMSGDTEELVDATFEVTARHDRLVEETVINRLGQFCDRLVDCNIGLFLCQKVIHPRLKTRLRSRGVIVVERLGSLIIPYVQDLTGATPILSIGAAPLCGIKEWLGTVTSVTHQVDGKKSFLHLSQPSSAVVTLVLCSEIEEKLSELKICAKTSLHGLYSLSKEPRLLAGGGCWQSYCSMALFKKVNENLSSLMSTTGCSKSQILSALTIFRSVLHQWIFSLIDKQVEDVLVSPRCGHVWKVPKGRLLSLSSESTPEELPDQSCCCGLLAASVESLKSFDYLNCTEKINYVPSNPETFGDFGLDGSVNVSSTLDNFSAASQALSNAVVTASLVSSVGQFITDQN